MLILVAIRDHALDSFIAPQFVISRGQAMREFLDQVNNPESTIGKHSEDYDLFVLGSLDEVHGVLLPLDSPERLIAGGNAKREPKS